MLLEQMTSSELREIRGQANLIVPFGSVEAHGPNLPLGTDTLIMNTILEGLHSDLQKSLIVCPVFTISPVNRVRCQGEDGQTNLRLCQEKWTEYILDMLINYVSSYKPLSLLLMTWHDTGDFIACLREICFRLKQKTGMTVDALRLWVLAKEYALGRGIVYSEERHAAKIETSLMLAIAPNLVKKDFLQNIPWQEKKYLAVDWSSFTDEGVYGNATESSSEIGWEILDFVASEAGKLVLEYFVGDSMLTTSSLIV